MMKPPIKINNNRTDTRWQDYWFVESESRPGVLYIVARTSGGDWGCNCPAWTKHYPRKDCKHINHVKRSLAGLSPAPIIQVKAEAQPEQVRKALSRFALLE